MQQYAADGMFSRVTPAGPVSGQPVCALAVDAEEDFDWDHPVTSTEHSTGCMQRIDDLQRVVGRHGVRPTYLLTYPVLQDDAAVALLARQIADGDPFVRHGLRTFELYRWRLNEGSIGVRVSLGTGTYDWQ